MAAGSTAPDYYPSGETLFQTNAGSNSSNYSDAKADTLIAATNTTNTSLDSYENYLAKQVPSIWEPNADYESPRCGTRSGASLPRTPSPTCSRSTGTT